MVAVSLKKKKNFFFFFFFFSFFFFFFIFFFFQAEDGIRDLVRSRGLGDVYKRQAGDDPEAHNDRNLWPSKELKVVMQGSHFEDPLTLSLIHI